jgi:hypothetical protein
MRLAWFKPHATADEAGNDTALLIRALAPRHDIDVIEISRAHDFVWQHARRPWDLCIYELGGSPAHQFVAAYAAHFPGIVLLRGLPRHHQALRSARLVIVPHEPVAQALADDYPGVRIRTLVPGVEPYRDDSGPLSGCRTPIVEALRWPPDGAALTRALAGFAAARPVIVFDGPETADWPSVDPQDWQPRAPLERRGSVARRQPICVSIDPRDAAHSLALARRRLEADPELRERLGRAAQEWWRNNATVAIATAQFEELLDQAVSRPAPESAHAADDGTAKARKILDGLGIVTGSGGAIGLWD